MNSQKSHFLDEITTLLMGSSGPVLSAGLARKDSWDLQGRAQPFVASSPFLTASAALAPALASICCQEVLGVIAQL